MSLPNYLAKIKSAGMYRFTFDKSQLPTADAETMRLVVGYSDKGPFNNPVYIESKQDFINLFGNINKRLEKKGVFFHRMALQALSAGPIIALNLKPFNATSGGTETQETIQYLTFDPCSLSGLAAASMPVLNLFDRDRFWKIEADQLPYKITKDIDPSGTEGNTNSYINIAATDSKEMSCSLFIRKCHDTTVKQYDLSFRDWYHSLGETVPEYLEDHIDEKVKDYFAEVFVFRGEFTEPVIKGTGVLNMYFDQSTTAPTLKTNYQNNFGETIDALSALANDENSNFIGVYRGILLPYFKDQLGSYVSLDIVFNRDKDTHKMIMKLDDALLEYVLSTDSAGTSFGEEGYLGHNRLTHWPVSGWQTDPNDVNSAISPFYLSGYQYNTIQRGTSAIETINRSLALLNDKGIRTALTNHVDSEYHYIIDTYAYIVPKASESANIVNSKFSISIVAKEKDNCLAIMNAPSRADLFKNINSFNLSDFEKRQYTQYIDLPSEVEGASHCAYYTPVVFGDGPVKMTIPSAALVSNLFMEKWSSRQPYYIVAGPNYGKIEYTGLIGPDYNYAREDLDIYEPMGINCIVYVPRKGTYINSNQTAKQTPVSALSKVHVRELVTYVQNEIEKIMQNYQWELNTQTLRDTIKTSADALLEKVKANGGVYEYINVCDGTNNTPEVIDNEMIILDTSIEPARGAGKMVQRLTIHKTGGISSLIK